MTPEETANTLARLFPTGENPAMRWEELLQQAGGLARLARFSELELAGLFNLPPDRARRLHAVFRLGKEALLGVRPPQSALCSPAEVFDYLAPRIGWPETEEFWVLGFNVRQQPLHLSLVAKGTCEQVSLSVGNVFRLLLHHGAARGLVVHTHPSGDPGPSEADLVLTERIVQTGRLLGLPIVDHLILGQGRFSSLADDGYLSVD
jgi:DNA repair protein RadC